MIKKGYHYSIRCDEPGCEEAAIIGVARFSQDAKRTVKQQLIKGGWVPGPVSTWTCIKCVKEELKEVARIEEIFELEEARKAASGAVTKARYIPVGDGETVESVKAARKAISEGIDPGEASRAVLERDEVMRESEVA